MQDGFIEFSDIKLQRAEVTRLYVKNYLNRMYERMMTSESFSELSIRHEFVCDAVYDFCNIGLLSDDVKKTLLNRVEKDYWLRRDQIGEEC